MNRHLLIYAGVGLLAISAFGAAAMAASDPAQSGRETSTELSVLANAGTTAQLATPARVLIRSYGESRGLSLRDPALLGMQGGRAFYSLTADGTRCFAAGSGTLVGPQIDVIACSTSFPSSVRPVLDLSVVEATVARPTFRFINLRGIAADGVARVAAANERGDVVAEARVVRNVYSLPVVGGEATTLLAFDRAGKVVYRFGTHR